jgi:hypothetical protein
MSVAVCRGPIVPAFEAPRWLKPAEPNRMEPVADLRPPARVDVWNAIQADVAKVTAAEKANKPYVHPLVRRSSCLMSQKSLEVCTESLGNETGSGDYTASLDCLFDSPLPAAAANSAAAEESFWDNRAAQDYEEEECEREELVAVNYHYSAVGTRSARRAFPPPLPSMSRRDGPCLQMRASREDGRLVMEAVAVRPRGYLHARRQGGRLRLAFVECSAREESTPDDTVTAAGEAPYFPAVDEPKNQQEEDPAAEMEEHDEEEEEIEVVERGTVIEVKVSTQPQPLAAGKVHRSRLVINKFVGGTPLTVDNPQTHNDTPTYAEAACDEDAQSPPPKLRRVPSSTTTLAAAVAAASIGSDDEPAPEEDDGGMHMSALEPKQQLLFTSRRGDNQDRVRRCRQLRQKLLFILEPYCIATS